MFCIYFIQITNEKGNSISFEIKSPKENESQAPTQKGKLKSDFYKKKKKITFNQEKFKFKKSPKPNFNFKK